MTNVLSYKVNFEGKDYIFMVTDSLSTDHRDKVDNCQKLVRRGNLLVASAGGANLGQNVKLTLLNENTDIPPYALAEKILHLAGKELEKDVYSRYPELEKGNINTLFVVAGKNKDSMEIYEVPIGDSETQKKGIYPVESSSIGTGAEKIMLARGRDTNQCIHQDITNLAEALFFCYSMGTVASEDIGVNDKLQYGLITPDSTRVLFHPVVETLSHTDKLEYLKGFSGIEVADPKKHFDEDYEKLCTLSKTINAFYSALELELARMNLGDITVNSIHTQLKSNRTNSFEDYQRALDIRNLHKKRVGQMLNSFLEGGIDKIVEAVQTFHSEQNEFLQEALKLKNN